MQTEDIQAAAGLRTSRLCILGLGALEGDKIIRTVPAQPERGVLELERWDQAARRNWHGEVGRHFFICTTLPENAAHT